MRSRTSSPKGDVIPSLGASPSGVTLQRYPPMLHCPLWCTRIVTTLAFFTCAACPCYPRPSSENSNSTSQTLPLFHLRVKEKAQFIFMVGLESFELPTSGFVDRRSNPDELQPHIQMVGDKGFEPLTARSQNESATRPRPSPLTSLQNWSG